MLDPYPPQILFFVKPMQEKMNDKRFHGNLIKLTKYIIRQNSNIHWRPLLKARILYKKEANKRNSKP